MIDCKICGAKVNFIELHISEAHAEETDMGQYTKDWPDAPTMSDAGASALAKRTGMISGNTRVMFGVSDTFNVRTTGAAPDVHGWEKPFWNTPALDSDYVFQKDLLASVLYAMESPGKHMLLTGPTGSGKTSVAEQVASRLNRPVYRMNFDSDISRSEFVGQMTLISDGGKGAVTKFQYGFLPRAMQEGAILILDEIDAGDPAVTMVLQGPLDGGQLTLLETGEVIHAHPDFRIFATANTVGQGDETGLYNGTQPQNYALLNRFKLVESVGYPNAAIEHKIINKKTGLTDVEGTVKKLVEVANFVRESHKRQEMLGTMSTRTLVNTAEVYLAFGDIQKAYRLTFLNGQNSEDKKVACEIIQRVWGVSCK